ncbi:MAG: 16S rRNA (guanine(966)-N(2))-methyltransferase RsmD [Eggerthellales bacterium]|nr:16S rRNA (guanine(966)-N(2))-methyltransferase RsmD [Eggerthellales bacterium]
MRIIAGEWRGCAIAAPKGDATRPTIDRIRESLMSSLYFILDSFDDVTVLDAFAGSGALGLEALSRGAKQAWFYEMNPQSHATLTGNIQKVHCQEGRAVVRKTDVLAHPPLGGHEPFGLVMLDPPYAMDPAQVFGLLEALDEAGALASYVTISYEHSRDTDLTPFFAASSVKWDSMQTKTYGEIAIDIFGKAEE